MLKKFAAAALTLCAAAVPLFAAPVASAELTGPNRLTVHTGSGQLADETAGLILCLIQLPPSASGDSSQGCPT
ncbi:hypothetical protein [Nocardia caishijiensis]|uniref:Uncharacterized protein n=1 Tax=Nocardia caishijiensis TaxID=184756 RepID=A0ABQ6YNA9_9NOCA|nr:hypothetical protein [Nocardia caishijiensis]KAF0847289.1 hypothetical protein FNL39_103187 [Nocardia caishijiensis]